MVEDHDKSLAKSNVEIRMIGVNTDKTRRTPGSTTVYQVYFELSETPPQAWNEIFGREWKAINAKQEAGIDGKFLVMHCPLQEIAATHLPALKKAVDAANVAFVKYSRDKALEELRKVNVWTDERKVVEDIVKSLRFD